MAFPWLFEENFETGTKGSFSAAESDDLGQLDFPGPQDDLVIPPYRGGYVMRVDMNRSVITTPTPAFLEDATAFSFAPGVTRHAYIMMYLDDDVVCPTAADNIKFWQMRTSATEEAALGVVRSDKGGLMIAIFSPDLFAAAGTVEAGWIRGIEVARNEWFCLELSMTGHASNSQLSVQIGDSRVSAYGMAWGTTTNFRLGSVSRTVDVRGIMYFDSIVVDEERLVAPQPIDPRNLDDTIVTFTKDGYAFVGAGTVDCLTIAPLIATPSATTHQTVTLYDTDRLPLAHHDQRMVAKSVTNESKESKGPTEFTRGCYVKFSGSPAFDATNAPTAIIKLGAVTEYGWGAFGEEGFAA